MSRLAKWLIGIVAAVALLILGAWLWLWFAFRGTPSDIVNFHAREFQAKGDAAFFYSVGDELKDSREIDPRATTLSRGHIDNFLVSPSRDKIAVVTGGTLLIGDADGSGIRLTRFTKARNQLGVRSFEMMNSNGQETRSICT